MTWMDRRTLLLAGVGALAGAQPAFAQPLDPDGLIRPDLLVAARTALGRPRIKRIDQMVVVDLAKPSRNHRLYIVNLKSGVVSAHLVAHGKGNDPGHTGRAIRFGDTPESNMTPLGAYAGAERYHGKHGLSLRLDGLDRANANARARAIVLHTEWYVSSAMAREHGKLGRSNGCFVVSGEDLAAVLSALEGGGLLYAGA